MSQLIRLLLASEATPALRGIRQRLQAHGFEVVTAADGTDLLALAERDDFQAAIVDPEGMDAAAVLAALLAREPPVAVVRLPAGCQDPDAVLELLRKAYHERVQRLLGLGEERVNQLLWFATGERPLASIRWLRVLEAKRSTAVDDDD